MKTIRVPWLFVSLATFAACTATGPRVLVTPAPGVESLPATVAVYPLLSTRPRTPIVHPLPRPLELQSSLREGGEGGVGGNEGERAEPGGIYILPPTESSLVVTGSSQLFSDLLAADLAYHGFRIKQLPVESPGRRIDAADSGGVEDGGQRFYVSMDLLDRLREEFGLEAVLLGNVYFEGTGVDPGDVGVTAAYVKVVDVKTLDVVCHVSVTSEYVGLDMEDVADRIASELAEMMAATPAEDPAEDQ